MRYYQLLPEPQSSRSADAKLPHILKGEKSLSTSPGGTTHSPKLTLLAEGDALS